VENFALLVPLIIIIPALGALANFFWGGMLTERVSALVGIGAALVSFVIAVLLFFFLMGTHGQTAVVDPPLLDGWIRIDAIGLNLPWQLRVDGLSVTMMLVVTGIGSLIHVYASGYMHGDPKFSRFFAFLNMFLAFMLILVTANNFLMLFVGWEGVGLCSYLLIGFWWDKNMPTGWKNSNAARKAFIVNRVGDFGILMAMFLMFAAFGTLDFYKPAEVENLPLAEEAYVVVLEEQKEGVKAPASEGETHSATEESAAHGDEHAHETYYDNTHLTGPGGLRSLGVFHQAEALMELGPDETLTVYAPDGTPYQQGRVLSIGPFAMDIQDLIVLVVLFMLLGVTGKSAQIPLFVWLPDAMAGPTPVSALIHAATMVTAGVYLLVRSNILLELSPPTIGLLITSVGSFTALMAGFIAMGQWDIKRVLAYSTISQLGFMVAAVGIGAYVAAIFHLATHAAFKALLFLASGSVIHGVEHGHHVVAHDAHDDAHGEAFDPQDMRNMGGLRHKMPITYWTYIIGTLALMGIPFFAGFWSKDEILNDAWHVGFQEGSLAGFMALGLLITAAGFTAFYMWRQIEMVFHGSSRSDAAMHAPESRPAMTLPLVILAFLATFLGFINVPRQVLEGVFIPYEFKHMLEPVIPSVTEGVSLAFNLPLAILATGLALAAIVLARAIYGGNRAVTEDWRDPLEANASTQSLWRLAHARLYWDEVYFTLIENPFNRVAAFFADVLDWRFLHDYVHDRVIVSGFNAVARFLANPFDLGVIDGAVNGVGRVTRGLGGWLRGAQTGYVRTYAMALFFGVVAVVVMMLLPFVQNAS
jgi:NADH-quinone oxidoreductase subunit L